MDAIQYVRDRLFELQDVGYADFSARLTPGIERDRFVGVRMPDLRKLAKSFSKMSEADEFISILSHYYYEENILHGMLISQIKDYEACLSAVERYIKTLDNWAACDTLKPRVFAKHKDNLITRVRTWIASDETYVCRFGMSMLMTHFLDDDFRQEYLELPAKVISEEYYVNMMIAWFYATALAKQWDDTITYIEDNRLGDWVHNKTIQKARESFRITPEQKEYLKSLKRRK